MDKPTAGRGGLGVEAPPCIGHHGDGESITQRRAWCFPGKGPVTVTCWQLVELLGEVGSSIRHTVETPRS